MRVQIVRQEIAAAGSEQERIWLFTSSIISKIGQCRIAPFFTGEKHARENLNQLLQRRAADLNQPMQMYDALARNEPNEFHTQLCHCLLHDGRQFVEEVENFPEESCQVIANLHDEYRFEVLTKKQELSDRDRLAFHYAHSQPVNPFD